MSSTFGSKFIKTCQKSLFSTFASKIIKTCQKSLFSTFDSKFIKTCQKSLFLTFDSKIIKTCHLSPFELKYTYTSIKTLILLNLIQVSRLFDPRFHTNFVNSHQNMYEITYTSLNLEFQAIYSLKIPEIGFVNLNDNSKVLKFCRSTQLLIPLPHLPR